MHRGQGLVSEKEFKVSECASHYWYNVQLKVWKFKECFSDRQAYTWILKEPITTSNF